MEDYSFEEMHNIYDKKILLVEDDEKFIINNFFNTDVEVIPLRLSYDLSKFSDNYIELTKKLFTYYANQENSLKNETLRLKKHFKHFMRTPDIAYIPDKIEYDFVREMLDDIGIKYVSSLEEALEILNNKTLIFFIDLDGTLTDSDGKISEVSKKAIKNTIKKGNKVVITTARPKYYADKLAKELKINDIVIALNGSLVYKGDEIISCHSINLNEIDYVINYCFDKNLRIILSTDSAEYVSKFIRNNNQLLITKEIYKEDLKGANVRTCMIIDENECEIKKLKEKVLKDKNVVIINEHEDNDTWKEHWFTIGNAKATKGEAVLKVSEYYNVLPKNLIAIGNGINDVSMFLECGTSIAMADSQDEVKAQAKLVARESNSECIANIINEITNKKD